MKICVPTSGLGGLDDEVGQHFGKVPTYTIFDTETNGVRVIENTSEHRGGVGLPPELISLAGADVMVVSGLGTRAVSMFESFGIRVYVGAHGTAKQALRMFQEGLLAPASDENACKEHASHGDH